MRRDATVLATLLLFTLAAALAARAGDGPVAPQDGARGWQIPPDAEREQNPLQVTPVILASGRALFRNKCQRCHGPEGLGNGLDADPEHREDMNLTNPARVTQNPDGVVFYKVWNGREQPKMPAFKSEMTRDQIWTVVSYVQTLRKPPM